MNPRLIGHEPAAEETTRCKDEAIGRVNMRYRRMGDMNLFASFPLENNP